MDITGTIAANQIKRRPPPRGGRINPAESPIRTASAVVPHSGREKFTAAAAAASTRPAQRQPFNPRRVLPSHAQIPASTAQLNVSKKSPSNSTAITAGTYWLVVPGIRRSWNQSKVGSKIRNCTTDTNPAATAMNGSQAQSSRRRGCRHHTSSTQLHATRLTNHP